MCTPDHSPNWRPLHPAELVQATDRCWDWQSREWRLVPEWCVGMPAESVGNRVYRRAGESPLPTTPREEMRHD